MEGGHPGRTGPSVTSAVEEEFRSEHEPALTPLRLMEGLSARECLYKRAPAPLPAQVRHTEQVVNENVMKEKDLVISKTNLSIKLSSMYTTQHMYLICEQILLVL